MTCYQQSSFPSGVATAGRTAYATEAECLQACKEGACCEGTTCSIKPQCQCQGAGKTFKGVGTTCTPNPCRFCQCSDITKASRVSFAISFSNYQPTNRLGIDVNTAQCSSQYGFNSRNFVNFRAAGETQQEYDARMVIINAWSAWLNSLTATLTFDLQASIAAKQFIWKGRSQSQTPFGASAQIPFMAFGCGIAVTVVLDDPSCFSQGPLVYPAPFARFNLSANPCNDVSSTPINTSFSDSVVGCALSFNAAGCATIGGSEANAYRNEFQGTSVIQTLFNPLP